MEAIILAGGQGKRLRSIVSNVPKPMAPINGTPFLEKVLNFLILSGFERVILSVCYKANSIIDFFGYSYKDLKIEYSLESEPLGTGGAVKQAISMTDSKNIFVLNGDTFLDLDFKLLADKFTNTNNPVIVVKKVNNISRYGEVILKNDIVDSFKSTVEIRKPGYINTGCYFFPTKIFDEYDIFSKKFSLEKDFFQHEMESKRLVFNAFICNNSFIDIGVPADFLRAQSFFDGK